MWLWRIFLTFYSTLNLYELASFLHHSTKLLFPNSPMSTKLFISYSTHFLISPGLSHFSKCHQHLPNRSSPNSRGHPFFFSVSFLVHQKVLFCSNPKTCSWYTYFSPLPLYPFQPQHLSLGLQQEPFILSLILPSFAIGHEQIQVHWSWSPSLFGKDSHILKPRPESTAWPSWTSADLIELYLFRSPTLPTAPITLVTEILCQSASQPQILLTTLLMPSFTFTGSAQLPLMSQGPPCPFLTGNHSFLRPASNFCTCVFHSALNSMLVTSFLFLDYLELFGERHHISFIWKGSDICPVASTCKCSVVFAPFFPW